jgi:hypothetical protein
MLYNYISRLLKLQNSTDCNDTLKSMVIFRQRNHRKSTTKFKDVFSKKNYTDMPLLIKNIFTLVNLHKIVLSVILSNQTSIIQEETSNLHKLPWMGKKLN